jgi:hypothetical protein
VEPKSAAPIQIGVAKSRGIQRDEAERARMPEIFDLLGKRESGRYRTRERLRPLVAEEGSELSAYGIEEARFNSIPDGERC